jgi:hypothetical protein
MSDEDLMLRFEYTNWHGDTHTYVIDPRSGHKPGLHVHEGEWCISGWVVSRDGDPRPEMGDNRRRTFKLAEMRNVENAL